MSLLPDCDIRDISDIIDINRSCTYLTELRFGEIPKKEASSGEINSVIT